MESKVYGEIALRSKIKNLDDVFKFKELYKLHQSSIGDITRKGIKLDYSELIYRTAIIETYDLNDIAEIIYEDLNSNLDLLIEHVNNYECEVAICIVINECEEDKPAFYFGKNLIGIAGLLKAYISVDGVY